MIYQTIESFKKYLEKAFPHNLLNLFFIIAKEEYERLKLIEQTICFLPRNKGLSVTKYSAENSSINELISNLQTPSLFGGGVITVLDNIEQFNNKELQTLVSFFKQNRVSSYLVLAAREKKSLLTLFSEIDKRGAILDLTNEKPWEKEKRFSNFIIEKCAQAKKTITQEAKIALLSFIGLDLASLENEMDKALIYVGEKRVLEKEDVLKVCSCLNTATVWQIAEKIVWEGSLSFFLNLEKEYCIDSSFFSSLVIALRYNLQEGLKIASALENNLDLTSFAKNMRYNLLEKRKERASFLKSSFYVKALEELFKIDLLSKQGISFYLTLIDLFCTKINRLTKYEQTNTCFTS